MSGDADNWNTPDTAGGEDQPATATGLPVEAADVWDECCQAFAWAMKEEPTLAPVSWLAYVHDNNPYRERASLLRTGETE